MVKAHLAAYRGRLGDRAGSQKWWELQQPALNLTQLAHEPKIVYPIIANECRFALDTDGMLVNDKVFVLRTSDLFVLGVLNSRVANFYFSEVCAALEGENDRYLEFRAQYVDFYPIPDIAPTEAARVKLIQLVAEILSFRKAMEAAKVPHAKDVAQRRIEATDRQIDQLVYELYGLTDEEIRIVESATASE